jgi:hypothetical protein
VITTPARSAPPWLAIIGFLKGMAGAWLYTLASGG